jgi:CCR4-NOT transcription complex subunit 1
MTFPPPHPSAQSSIASGTDKSSSTRTEIGAWGRSSSQSGIRRGLTPLATNLSSSAVPSTSARGLDAGPGASTPSSFSAVLSSARALSGGSPKPAPSPFTSLQSGSQQQAQSLSSPKFRAHTPSSGSHFPSAAGPIPGSGGTGGGGGPGSSRGVAFSPLSSGTTVNSPTGFASDKPGSAAHSSQSSLTKISIAQVFLLLDSITEKEGKEKWETKAAQIHKVSLFTTPAAVHIR